MRLPLVSAVVASVALVQVGASPIKLDLQGGSSFRFGHALGGPIEERSTLHVTTFVATPNGGAFTRVKTHCKGMKARLQQKTIELSNAFRQALGLPTIRLPAAPPTDGFVRILPIGPPSFIGNINPPVSMIPSSEYPDIPSSTHNPEYHILPSSRHSSPRHRRLGCRKTSFLKRIHVALTALGPWEGRAVAFVLGCGFGVLLRMVWVLAVVSYRTIKGPNDSDNEYSEIVFVEEVEEESPAPAYTDEKVEVEPVPVVQVKN